MTPVAALAGELLALVHARDPIVATLSGFREWDGALADHSAAGEAAAAARLRDLRDRAQALDPADDPVTRAVVLAHAEAMLVPLAAHAVEYTVTPLYHSPAARLLHGLPMIGIATETQETAYLTRLRAVPALLDTLVERHRAGIAAGRTPVRRLVDAAVAHLDRYLSDVDGDPLGRPFVGAARLGPVRAAFTRYRDALAGEIAPHGRPDDRAGLCALPDGAADYARRIRAHTTTDRTPEDLHRTGLALVARLDDEYRATFGSIEELRTRPPTRWRDATEPLDVARAAFARAEAAAAHWFGRLPRGECLVAAVPPAEAPDAPPGSYLPAALDGSRPAVYHVNTHRATERDRSSAEAVTFHETIPGHHLAMSLQQESGELHPLRRTVQFDAFGEGWALYAERLADEMGLYSDDEARLGMLAGESLRAARMVADTGLHAFGWSRAEAVTYLRTHTLLSTVDIEREVDRYLGDPGQAVAYVVGRLEIERLRASATAALGPRFAPADFHDAVLRNGEVPLDALADVMARWVASQRPA
jgi:uncharacterized protein (DUF885 family)